MKTIKKNGYTIYDFRKCYGTFPKTLNEVDIEIKKAIRKEKIEKIMRVNDRI